MGFVIRRRPFNLEGLMFDDDDLMMNLIDAALARDKRVRAILDEARERERAT